MNEIQQAVRPSFDVDEPLYQDIIKDYLRTYSIKKSALNLGVSEVRVRKVLLTEGLWSSRTSILVQHYLDEHFTTAQIAEKLHTTLKAVQQYLPYSRGIYGGTHLSSSAVNSAEYRERIRNAKERALKKKRDVYVQEGWEEEEAEMDKNPIKNVLRLHLELMREPSDPEGEEITRVLHRYGRVEYGDTISRDILIPADMPLYALHYAIQRLFGWQNSHLHKFNLPPARFLGITDNNAGKWSRLVGVLFRSPWMDEADAFWADDYEDGSFKTWIRKKYTGPYLSLCHGEGIIRCTQDVKDIFARIPQVKILYSRYEGELQVASVEPLRKKTKPGEVPVTEEDRKRAWFGTVEKAEICALEDCPAEALIQLFMEQRPDDLLERLPIGEVLAPAKKIPGGALAYPEKIRTTYDTFMEKNLQITIQEILESRLDLPKLQPPIPSPTDVLYYNYDFGDDWKIRITASLDAGDLVEQGRVTQQELEEAIETIHKTYRPVCIAADGPYLVDDAGGISGYIRFLRAINPTAERDYWGKDNMPDNWSYEDKQTSLEWARSLGWTERVNKKRML